MLIDCNLSLVVFYAVKIKITEGNFTKNFHKISIYQVLSTSCFHFNVVKWFTLLRIKNNREYQNFFFLKVKNNLKIRITFF